MSVGLASDWIDVEYQDLSLLCVSVVEHDRPEPIDVGIIDELDDVGPLFEGRCSHCNAATCIRDVEILGR